MKGEVTRLIKSLPLTKSFKDELIESFGHYDYIDECRAELVEEIESTIESLIYDA